MTKGSSQSPGEPRVSERSLKGDDDLLPYLTGHRTGDGVCQGQPPLVCEGILKPLSEPAPFAFHGYCLEFDHIVAMQFAHTTYVPEMVQAIFYAMDKLKDAQASRLVETVYNPWSRPAVTSRLRDAPPLRVTRSSTQHPRPLPKDHLILYRSFDLGIAIECAQDSNIPEMLQAIFYIVVVNENVECRLRGAQASCSVNPPPDLASSSGPMEASGLSDAFPVSSDVEKA
ncbi:hypothetical protein Cgig2_027462 [Carnegiea gigantea]|uniref:Uncharacterized protein n=1 Tax=Carnegiea gigantea TaxID=171969 RepID=A0A9Q1KP44_9CARY|nr:hypothetical protein Cgig2_027462 [Carnegiea gigantea]